MSWPVSATERRLDACREEGVHQEQQAKYRRPQHEALLSFVPADDGGTRLAERERALSRGRRRQAFATAGIVHPVRTLHRSEHRQRDADATAVDVRPKRGGEASPIAPPCTRRAGADARLGWASSGRMSIRPWPSTPRTSLHHTSTGRVEGPGLDERLRVFEVITADQKPTWMTTLVASGGAPPRARLRNTWPMPTPRARAAPPSPHPTRPAKAVLRGASQPARAPHTDAQRHEETPPQAGH